MIGLKNLTSACSRAETHRCRIVRVTWLRLNAETDTEVVEIPATAIASHCLRQPETAGFARPFLASTGVQCVSGRDGTSDHIQNVRRDGVSSG
jgi:hypothetical protein